MAAYRLRRMRLSCCPCPSSGRTEPLGCIGNLSIRLLFDQGAPYRFVNVLSDTPRRPTAEVLRLTTLPYGQNSNELIFGGQMKLDAQRQAMGDSQSWTGARFAQPVWISLHLDVKSVGGCCDGLPKSAATSASERSSMLVCQKAFQVDSSNSMRSISIARRVTSDCGAKLTVRAPISRRR